LKARKTSLPFSFWNSIYSLIGGLLLLSFFGKKWVQISYCITAGLLGIFFTIVGVYSLHEEILWNYNILLFNPLLIAYAWGLWKGNTTTIKLLAKIILGGIVVYILYMLDKIHLQIVWPFIALHLYWLGKEVLKKN
jgi:hypothetical protein